MVIYPNPTETECTVRFLNPRDGRVYVVAPNGVVMKDLMVYGGEGIVDVSALQSGIYIVMGEQDGEKYSQTLVVK